MGLFSWLFPSPDDRVARAQSMLDGKRWADARLEVMDLDHPGAKAIVLAAEVELAKLNLDHALSWANAGDDVRVAEHLDLAETFSGGQVDDLIRDTRRALREIRQSRDAAAQRRKAAEDARLLEVDPVGLTGGPSWLDPTAPADLYDAERDEMEARVGLIVENYPEHLRASVGALGATFARAVLDLEDGRPDLALQALLALPDDAALVQWERARTAHVLGDAKAAARAVQQFAALANGHQPMGATHSATLLAQLLTEAGDLPGALRVLRDARARAPKVGGALYAQLLLATGDLPAAEAETVALVREHPRTRQLYGLLAQIRLAGGHRVAAMRALEQGIGAAECTPGKCGYQPPDPSLLRTLATLYLEDGVEPKRGRDLASQALQLVEQPTWDDAYLSALLARSEGAPDATERATRLAQLTPDGDPRRARLVTHLGAPA